MIRGQKPKPTALKILEGNRGRRPLNDREPKPPVALPPPPDHLDAVAIREWRRVCKQLYELGIMSRLDVAILACYCDSYSEWVHFKRDIRTRGTIISNRKRGRVVNPMIRLAMQAKRELARYAVELGITPSARSRVRVDEIPKLETEEDEAGRDRDEFLD